MAVIKPFYCIRPKAGLEQRIAALPYDVYSREEALEEVKKEPMSFLKIDRAETQFPLEVDTYDARVYEKARDTLCDMMHRGELVKENAKGYYIYRLTRNGQAQTGLAACASVDDYLSGRIKKHENTRADKEADRISHVDVCNAQTGPIFLAYRKKDSLPDLNREAEKGELLYNFVSEDGIGHTVWKIQDEDQIQRIEQAFFALEHLYIADGHHRAASAIKVALKRRAEHPDFNEEEEFNYFLAVIFPEEELTIMDYNRIVKDLNGLSPDELLKAAAKGFEVEHRGETPYKPEQKGCMGMYLDSSWYKLTAKPAVRKEHPVDGLDVSVLQNELLAPVLGITDPKTDKRIAFTGGVRGLIELEKQVKKSGGVAFAMYPTSMQELLAVSDAGLLMPPKSTWFEPKLRSGLFIHELT